MKIDYSMGVERAIFKVDGKEYLFIDFVDSEIQAWDVIYQDIAKQTEAITIIDIPLEKVSKEDIEELRLWDAEKKEDLRLALIAKKELFTILSEETDVLDETGEVHKGRKGRKRNPAYAHLPRKIKCSNCSEVDYMPPSILVKKVELSGSPREQLDQLEEWNKTYKCSKCAPRKRGRKSNPLYSEVPRKKTCCRCGKEAPTNAKGLYEEFAGDIEKIKKECFEYLCRDCNPNSGAHLRGKGRRGRQPLPENVGFPKKALCTGCKKEVAITPNNIRNKAKVLGLTVEEVIDNYKCRSCGGRLKKQKK